MSKDRVTVQEEAGNPGIKDEATSGAVEPPATVGKVVRGVRE